jgi:RNA polymerase sigma-70 factor (ECF subfamily)
LALSRQAGKPRERSDAEARRRLLELTHDRLMHHARRLLHGQYARLEPFAQTDDIVQQLYVKILQNQDCFWVNADGGPVQTLATRQAYGRDDNRPAVLPLDGVASDTGPLHEPSSETLEGEKLRRWTEFHEAVARLPDDLRPVFDLLWYQEMSQAEAAALLGIAVPPVKLRWMKARLQVQQALGGTPFDDTGSPD